MVIGLPISVILSSFGLLYRHWRGFAIFLFKEKEDWLCFISVCRIHPLWGKQLRPGAYGPFAYSPIHDRPKITWPNGAKLALWVIPNIEFHALNEKTPDGTGKIPDVSAWSRFDYGNRVGVFRIMDVLDKHDIRGTVALNADVCDQHPEIVRAAMDRKWEFMGHCESNTRWLGLAGSDAAAKDIVLKTVSRIADFTGQKPKGWLGAGLDESWNTLDHLIEAGLTYVADWVNDDQPYLMDVGGKRLVSIPYSTEVNDRPAFRRFLQSPEAFATMVKRQFDVLYREADKSGRVMAIALHPNLIGMPYRIKALDDALSHICGHDGVWRTTGSEIVEHYLASQKI